MNKTTTTQLDTIPCENVAETVARLMADHMKPHILSDGQDGKPLLIAANDGMKVTDMTDNLNRVLSQFQPPRRKGTDVLTTLDSLIDWSNRFKGDSSVLFADKDPSRPSLICIANYHKQGPANPTGRDETASYGDHRGMYSFPLSKEWKYWEKVTADPLSMDELGEVIESAAKDFLEPTPALLGAGKPSEDWEKRMIETAAKLGGRFAQYSQMILLAREFALNEASTVQVKRNRDSGEQTAVFVNEHKDATGQEVKVPNLFMIAIPVFDGGALYRLPVRLRYRTAGGKVQFILTRYDPESAFQDAFEEAVTHAGAETVLPVFYGKTGGN